MAKKVYETLHINDECYTPDYAVRPLVKYLERFKGKTIWCPFDTEESEFVKILTAEGHKVIYSHKDSGDNFYDFGDGLFAQEMPEFDLIVSNPPFHNKAMCELAHCSTTVSKRCRRYNQRNNSPRTKG